MNVSWKNILLIILLLQVKSIAYAQLLPKEKKQKIVAKEEFLNVVEYRNFEDAFNHARQGGRDFFIYKGIVYHPFSEEEWERFSESKRAKITLDCGKKAKAYLLVKEFWEELGETNITNYWFTDDEVNFDGKIFRSKRGEQTSDYCYEIEFTIDLKADRIKYLSELMEVNPYTGRGKQTTILWDWIDHPCRGNYDKWGDFYVKPGMIAEKIRQLLNE